MAVKRSMSGRLRQGAVRDVTGNDAAIRHPWKQGRRLHPATGDRVGAARVE